MASLKKRGKSYQIQYYEGGRQKRIGLGEIPLQLGLPPRFVPQSTFVLGRIPTAAEACGA